MNLYFENGNKCFLNRTKLGLSERMFILDFLDILTEPKAYNQSKGMSEMMFILDFWIS